MKTIILTFILICCNVYAVVPNIQYYIDAEKRIVVLETELQEITSSLSTINSENSKLKYQLKKNIENEIKLIKQRVELFKKLEREQLIMYSSS
jgi:predicted nuclease with TOPRIM domain